MQVTCRDAVDVNRAAANGNTPLHVAASFGDDELLSLLLTARGVDVNALNVSADGATPLHCAVMHGKLYCTTTTLAAGLCRDGVVSRAMDFQPFTQEALGLIQA